MIFKKLLLTLVTACAFSVGTVNLSAAHHEGEMAEMAPHSIIHVVTVSWKESATPAQIQAALDGVKTIAKDYEGVTRVWIKTIKAQGDRSHAFVMEFKDQASFDAYTDSDAQKAWYKLYLPVRERSTTFDITN